MQQLSERLFLYKDTCNVYLIKSESEAILIDFGDGEVLNHLSEVGVDRVTDVLMTHHHRDQAQGLWKAVELGIRIWVPEIEQDLFSDVDAHWQGRQIYNHYDVRQDRFSLLNAISVSGCLKDYDTFRFHDIPFFILPTPGHTMGSITLVSSIDGQQLAFTGDLIAGHGKLWSVSATQWTYNNAEGVAASILSLLDLQSKEVDMLLPSHGYVMTEPDTAIGALVANLNKLLDIRGQYRDLEEWAKNPYVQITPHLLWNRTCWSYSYVLLSESGKALMIDYGYDFNMCLKSGGDRATGRPWLYTLEALKRNHHVKSIDAAILTHHHDDHVAGLNVLRRVEGAQIWAAANFADILENPAKYDLPCLWYDPIPVDRVLPLGETIKWEEYELHLHELPGHTRYAVGISFVVDGKKMLATGDQQGNDEFLWNYVYSNRFAIGDYSRSGELYKQIRPDLMLSGHWEPLWVNDEIIEKWRINGIELDQVHRELLPVEMMNMDAEGFCARLYPYQSEVREGASTTISVEVRNPSALNEHIRIKLVCPENWGIEPLEQRSLFAPKEEKSFDFHIRLPKGLQQRRARIAADITVGDVRLGQHAEALITVK